MIERLSDRFACLLPWPKGKRVAFFSLRPGTGGPGTFSGRLAEAFGLCGIEPTYRRLRAAQSALIFSQSSGTWFHGICRAWGTRTVLRVDGFMVPSYFDNRPRQDGGQDRRLTLSAMAGNYRIQRDIHLCDHVIYQSSFCKRMADHFLYSRRERYSIIHNGVDLSRFCPSSKKKSRKIALLSLGVLRHEYMLANVLGVYDYLRKRHDLELHLVGSLDGICRRQLTEYLRASPSLGSDIKYAGHVNAGDLPYHINQTDVLIHPRLGDSCPNAVIECLACGVPVVCGSWGGTSELVGGGGIVVPTEEWSYDEKYRNGLCKAAETVLSNLDEFKKRARERAEQAFALSRVAEAYAAVMGFEKTT
jgi:glycosyltransferase involved in cell wall biosynthesis